jgi:hypothetical protein
MTMRLQSATLLTVKHCAEYCDKQCFISEHWYLAPPLVRLIMSSCSDVCEVLQMHGIFLHRENVHMAACRMGSSLARTYTATQAT